MPIDASPPVDSESLIAPTSEHDGTSSSDTLADKPRKRRQTIRDPELDWNQHRSTIRRLYVDEAKTLDETIMCMESTYHFKAKKRGYKEKFRQWGFEKNIPARDMKVVVAHVEERKRKEGKETNVYFNDRLVDKKKLERFKKRCLFKEEKSNPILSAIPSNIRCTTPPKEGRFITNTLASDFTRKDSVVQAHATEEEAWPKFSVRTNIDHDTEEPDLRRSQTLSSYSKPENHTWEARTSFASQLLSQAWTHRQPGSTDRDKAEALFRRALDLPDDQKNISITLDALYGIVSMYTDNESFHIVPELERLVGGYACLYGFEHMTWLTYAMRLAWAYLLAQRKQDLATLLSRIIDRLRSLGSNVADSHIRWLKDVIPSEATSEENKDQAKSFFVEIIQMYENDGRAGKAIVILLWLASWTRRETEHEANSYLLQAMSLFEGKAMLGFSVCNEVVRENRPRVVEEDPDEFLNCFEALLHAFRSHYDVASIDGPVRLIIPFLERLRNSLFRYKCPAKHRGQGLSALLYLARTYSQMQLYDEARQICSTMDLAEIRLSSFESIRQDPTYWNSIYLGVLELAGGLPRYSNEFQEAESLLVLACKLAELKPGLNNYEDITRAKLVALRRYGLPQWKD